MEQWIIWTLFAAVIVLSEAVLRMNRRIKRSDYLLQSMMDGARAPEYHLEEELRQLIRDKDKIKAIKRAQQRMGLTLREAKEYVESL
ncbi:hypothetical protein ACP26L_20365 [Paenibacillus sp. S-38]|uniref:hypothetical protein n=1 Tax=Paenibacillus sp. S-38 TaxID=3416710 RepID=UPI003CE6E786